MSRASDTVFVFPSRKRRRMGAWREIHRRSHARGSLSRQPQRRAAQLPRSDSGSGRGRDRDEGLRDVRLGSQVLPLAPGAAQAALGLGELKDPFIAGHEPCGVVVARGPGVSAREAPDGQRVMDHHYAGCGTCPHCRVGWSQLCRSGITVYGVTAHGGHADYLKVPSRTLVPLPEELSFAEGAAVACGTGTAYGALRRMRIAGGDTLAVFGQGPVGLSATLLGRAMGARVIAVETTAERLKLAKDFGADSVVDASKEE